MKDLTQGSVTRLRQGYGVAGQPSYVALCDSNIWRL
jgi:hypothetical protein